MNTLRLRCSLGNSIRSWPALPIFSGIPSSLVQASPAQELQSARQWIADDMTMRRRWLRTAKAPQYSSRRLYSNPTGPGKPEENATKSDGSLSKTQLHDLHVERGGKMVPFAGYSMPVQYSDLSVGDSHRWTREKASLFDVGHMVQHHIGGPGATSFLETITPSSVAKIPLNRSQLSCLLHPFTGGIVDDTVITRLGPQLFYLVTNAACKKKDLAYLQEQLDNHDQNLGAVTWEVRDGWGLVALQGPLSADVLLQALQKMGNEKVDLLQLYFGQCVSAQIYLPNNSKPDSVLISRGGYTGEDGFEISIPPEITRTFTETLLEVGGQDRLRLAGLGARDSLRLEAGMCLYGHDLNDDITPVEAGLSWIVSQDRRVSGGFHGHETIVRQLDRKSAGGGVEKRRVGLTVEGAPAREGASIVSKEGETLGTITSGCPSPTLGQNIAMGYVKSGMHKAGTDVDVKVRGKVRPAKIVKMPFVASKYWKEAAGTAPA